MLTGNREIFPMPCFFQSRQRMQNSFAAVSGVELLQRFEFVVHFRLVILSESERPRELSLTS